MRSAHAHPRLVDRLAGSGTCAPAEKTSCRSATTGPSPPLSFSKRLQNARNAPPPVLAFHDATTSGRPPASADALEAAFACPNQAGPTALCQGPRRDRQRSDGASAQSTDCGAGRPSRSSKRLQQGSVAKCFGAFKGRRASVDCCMKMPQAAENATRGRRERTPTVLIVCDGWGVASEDPAVAERRGDAVAKARTPVRSRLRKTCPWSLLATSGNAVGLSHGRMGNSEVGHLNLGAGRIVPQDATRIDKAVADGSLFKRPALVEFLGALRRSGGRLHLAGLCSDGGVHSDVAHLRALLRWAHGERLPVRIHCFADGRDAPPHSGLAWIEEMERWSGEAHDARIASVSGRHYAMDRDRRWARTERAYRAMAEGVAPSVRGASRYLAAHYERGESDEHLPPAVVSGPADAPAGIAPEDGVLFFNFRADRARQIVSALADPDFSRFPRSRPSCSRFVAMTPYRDDFRHPVLFPRRVLRKVLGEALADAGRTQLRMAETEKYPHVTYFFNGGVEDPFPGEDRQMVPSPKVDTYDAKPEMSAPELTDALLARLDERRHDFVLVNFANADMVGHTGNLSAATKAVETVDRCVGRVLERVAALGGTALVTADHGNAEQMLDEDGGPFTAHTTGPVRVFLATKGRPPGLRDGVLADVAPTILELMGVPQPPEMTGTSLLSRGKGR